LLRICDACVASLCRRAAQASLLRCTAGSERPMIASQSHQMFLLVELHIAACSDDWLCYHVAVNRT
jgi:hypothetical protein